MNLMISTHRKTRKGSVVKIVREHYLRCDIHCGCDSCRKCKKFKLDPLDQFAPNCYLSDNPRKEISSSNPESHYIVVDYYLLLNQIDLIGDVNFGEDIIIMQTVWKEIKPHITVFLKLKELMASRRFYLFDNEHHQETFRYFMNIKF